jgi:hypothetical protein
VYSGVGDTASAPGSVILEVTVDGAGFTEQNRRVRLLLVLLLVVLEEGVLSLSFAVEDASAKAKPLEEVVWMDDDCGSCVGSSEDASAKARPLIEEVVFLESESFDTGVSSS